MGFDFEMGRGFHGGLDIRPPSGTLDAASGCGARADLKVAFSPKQRPRVSLGYTKSFLR